MKWGIVVFPGSNCDRDCGHAVEMITGVKAEYIWHKEQPRLADFSVVILPGGFSYGDYLRPGAIAAHSPVMAGIKEFARQGGFVVGICNGFQVLLELGLLPGAMLPNRNLQFVCTEVHLRIENNTTALTEGLKPGQVIRLPLACGDGNYYIDAGGLAKLNAENRILFRYCTSRGLTTAWANPVGAVDNIAGITNSKGNVFGLMPHPERAVEEVLLMENTVGNLIFNSLARRVRRMQYAR